MSVRRFALTSLALVACDAAVVTPPPPPPEPVTPQRVMVKGRVGTFVEPGPTVLENGVAFADTYVKWWHIPGREKYFGVSNVYDGIRPVLDSLMRVYPSAQCVRMDEQVVDCLRIPVHVEDQVVWTDDEGYFTAGPFLEGTEIRAWVDHEKLPMLLLRPDGRIQCDDRLNVGTPCEGIISLYNWEYRWKGYNPRSGRDAQVDTVRVLVGETNTRVYDPKTRTHTWPDHFVIPAWETFTAIVRLPNLRPRERLRFFGQPAKGPMVDTGRVLESNWKGEVILRDDIRGRSVPNAYIQMRDANDNEVCGLITARPPIGGPPSALRGTHYTDYKGDVKNKWLVDCAGAPPNTALYQAWQPPPPLYP